MIEAICYDLDQTLLKLLKYKERTARAAAKAMVKHGIGVDEETLYRLIFMVYDERSMEYEKTYYEVVKSFGLEVNRAERIQQAAILAHQKAMHHSLELFPMVMPTLEELKIRWPELKHAVVTDALRNKALKRMTLTGLVFLIDDIISHSDTGEFKPSPLPFELALKVLEVAPERCLFVGDDPGRDIKGAKEAGMLTCWARYGFESGRGYRRYDEAEAVAADFEIGRADGLVDVVEKLQDPGLADMREARWASLLWKKRRLLLKGAIEKTERRFSRTVRRLAARTA